MECVPWMIVGAVIFLFLQAPGGHPALRIILAWMVIRPLYVMVLLRLGLSDGSIVSYVTFYNEFDQHARLLFSGPFAPLASMIGGTLFMFCFGLLCICIWKVIDLSSAGLFSNIRLSNHPPRWLHWRLLAGFYYLSMWCWSLTKVSQASGNDGFMFWTAHKWKGTILVSLRLIVISAATFIMAKYCGKRWIGWRLTKKTLLEGFCGLLWSFWLTLGMVLLFRASGRWSSAQWKAPTGDELWYALLMMLQVIVFVLIFQYATVQLLLCRLTFTNAAWFISLVCGFTLAASTGGSWRSFFRASL